MLQLFDIRLVSHQNRHLRNITGMVTDSLHICNHFQCRRNNAQISGHRLLLQEQLQAEILNRLFLMVNILIIVDNFFCLVHILCDQGGNSLLDCLLDHAAHLDHFIV